MADRVRPKVGATRGRSARTFVTEKEVHSLSLVTERGGTRGKRTERTFTCARLTTPRFLSCGSRAAHTQLNGLV